MAHDRSRLRSTERGLTPTRPDDDYVEAEHDPARARRASLADLRRYAAAHGAPASAEHADGARAPLRAGATTATSQETKAPSTALPAGHGSREIKIEFGDGSVTGGITATLEYGKTGVPLGPDQIKALENTSAVQLNGLKTKLETAVLSGELEGDLFEGLKITVEANALKAGVDSDGAAEVDLATISIKLVGDAGHLLNAGPNVTLTVDGNLSIALGGKLAAQLSSYVVAQLEQQMLAKEMSEVGDQLDDSARKLKDLTAKADLLESQGSLNEARKLRDEALQHRLKVSTGTRQIDGLKSKLTSAKARADKAIGKLQGKLAKQVAKAMEKKAIKFVATKLMKLVPILNLVSTVMDVVELVGIIKNLIEGDFDGVSDGDKSEDKNAGDGGGDAAKAKEGAAGDESSRADTTAPATQTKATGGEGTSAATEAELFEARQSLRPAARAVVDGLTLGGLGARLSADQVKMVGLLIPQDLTADQLTELLAILRHPGGKARTAEEVIEAVSAAVRAIKNRDSTVKVNGEQRGDLATGATHDDRVDEAASSGVPVTSPSQVEGPSRASEVVRGGDAATIGRWFKAEGDELVSTQEGQTWKSEHMNTELEPDRVLTLAEETITNTGPGAWRLEVRFRLMSPQRQRFDFTHRLWVRRGGEDDGFGAKVGELKFEGYVVVGDP